MKLMIRLCSIALLLPIASAAQAGGIVANVSGGSGSTAYDAQATFTFGSGSLSIDLNNLIVNPKSVVQNVSALSFTLTDAFGTKTSYTSSGYERNVALNGSYSDVSGAVSTGWALGTTGTKTISLDVLAAGGVGPEHTLIGEPGGSTYSNANSSITGNGPHNPFLHGDANFVLDYSGFSAGSTLSSVTFQFGTTDGSNQHTTTSFGVTPEPSTLIMLGTVAVGGIGVALRRRVIARRIS